MGSLTKKKKSTSKKKVTAGIGKLAAGIVAGTAKEKLSLPKKQKFSFSKSRLKSLVKAKTGIVSKQTVLSSGAKDFATSIPAVSISTISKVSGSPGMKKASFSLLPNASVSVASVMARRSNKQGPSMASRAAGFLGDDDERIHESDPLAVLVETKNPDELKKELERVSPLQDFVPLSDGILSVKAGENELVALVQSKHVERIQTKKKSQLHMTSVLPSIGVYAQNSSRAVQEDGAGVLIGIVDSGFDLSHPAFKSNGKLRVAGLLDQTGSKKKEFTTAKLEADWAGGSGPGADDNGHGTHVASIAGGTKFQGYEGVAPGAEFLLVKTNFMDTDEAVKWIFDKAAGRPCVINMSLGHHFGSHDGTDVEERLHRSITGAGKIICVSAGNEREDDLHIGGRFSSNQTKEVSFDVVRTREGAYAVITLWHDEKDDFDVTLITPTGSEVPLPVMGQSDQYQSTVLDIEFSRKPYVWSNSTQVQIALSFKNAMRERDLRNWRLRISCKQAVIGRIDGWFQNSGYARFHSSSLVENHRTLGLPASGDGCIAVASHVSRNAWTGDDGQGQDVQAVVGRSSSFSSLGPTRDGRSKPEISAPGQYVTAALADRSEMAGWSERALANQRLLSIEGTSMSCPVVSGVVALLLQKKPTLTIQQVREILQKSAVRDGHTGAGAWDPAYGFGKIDVPKALALA